MTAAAAASSRAFRDRQSLSLTRAGFRFTAGESLVLQRDGQRRPIASCRANCSTRGVRSVAVPSRRRGRPTTIAPTPSSSVGEARDLRHDDVQRINVETGAQHAERPRERSGRIADRHADAAFADVEAPRTALRDSILGAWLAGWAGEA